MSAITIFCGPSWRPQRPVPGVIVCDPARRGDLIRKVPPTCRVVVLLDATLTHFPGPSHPELLGLLARGVRIIGASSAGALRAVELRGKKGMKGVGEIYNAVLLGNLIDDGELAVAMHPRTFASMTVPLINVRRLLKLAIAKEVRPSVAETLLTAAKDLYFMDRTPDRLAAQWKRACNRVAWRRCIDLLDSPLTDAKAEDACTAIRVARGELDWRPARLDRFFWTTDELTK